MRRRDILKAVAALPFVGAVLSSPTAVETEDVVGQEAEVLSTSFGQFTRGGMMLWSNPRPDWPTPAEIEDAAAHGFDRFEIWSNIRGVIYQAPTIADKLPAGWYDFNGVGFLKGFDPLLHDVPAWIPRITGWQ